MKRMGEPIWFNLFLRAEKARREKARRVSSGNPREEHRKRTRMLDFWTAIIYGVPAIAAGIGLAMGRRALWEAQTLTARFLRQPTPLAISRAQHTSALGPCTHCPPLSCRAGRSRSSGPQPKPGPLSASPVFGPSLFAAVALKHSHGAPVAGIKHIPNQRRLLAARTTRPGRIGFEAGKDFVFELAAHESDARRLSQSQVTSARIVPYRATRTSMTAWQMVPLI